MRAHPPSALRSYNAWGYPANCKIPLSRSPYGHCVASYAADPGGSSRGRFIGDITETGGSSGGPRVKREAPVVAGLLEISLKKALQRAKALLTLQAGRDMQDSHLLARRSPSYLGI